MTSEDFIEDSQLRCSSITYEIVNPQDGEHTKLRVLDCGYAE